MSTPGPQCPNCGSSFNTDEKCSRCGRPRHESIEYLELVEDLANAVVGEAYDEFADFSVGQGDSEGLRGAIARLGARLRHYHYDGDGCVDD